MIRVNGNFDKDVFGRNVLRLRTEKGMTQQELAGKCDCSENMISQIERGKKGASINLAAKIASHLGTNLDGLLHDKK